MPVPSFHDDITPTATKPTLRLSPAMIPRSRSATPTALAAGTSGSESDRSGLTSTTGSASTVPPSSTKGSTQTGRRANATASLKRIFRQTFQSPRPRRAEASSPSPSRPSFKHIGNGLGSLQRGCLPQIPRVDTVFLKDFDEVGAGMGERQERQSIVSNKSSDVRVRRVSTLGATVSIPSSNL